MKDAMNIFLILVVMWFLYTKVIEKYTEDSVEATLKVDILKFFNETKEPYYHNYVDIFINAGLTDSVLMTQENYKKFLELHKQNKLTEQVLQ